MYDLLFFCQNLSSFEKNGADKDHTPENRKTAARATFVFRSTQAPLRHIGKHPLMLLGSPPDMVRESRLRKTRVSTRKNKKQDRTKISLRTGIHPCCSGLQVQGSAMSPVSVTFVRAVLKALKKDRIYYNTKREKNQGKKQNSRLFHAFRAFCEKAGGKPLCRPRKHIPFLLSLLGHNHDCIFVAEKIGNVTVCRAGADAVGSLQRTERLSEGLDVNVLVVDFV